MKRTITVTLTDKQVDALGSAVSYWETELDDEIDRGAPRAARERRSLLTGWDRIRVAWAGDR